MIISFPPTLTDWSDLRLPGRLSLASKAENTLQVDWTNDGLITTLTVDMIARTIEIPDAAEQALKDILQLKLTAFGQPPGWVATYDAVKAAAQSAVGVMITDLTVTQQKALVALLLWDHKAITDDLKIKPLNQWVKRRLNE